ncbi:NUDIX hydrolase [Shouchella clausii]|uniref:NUDIX hydrolase n=1 Tax=Shouchella clausii TaxID=79880 RepID=UPI00211CD535|nr:NUDIX domain-containing protein [Shouchella clausii]
MDMTCGILLKDGKVLISEEADGTVTLSGGAVKTGETTAEAIVREYKEESGLKVKSEKLLAIIENFLRYNNSDYHQHIYVYELKLIDEDSQLPKLTQEEKMLTRWIDVESLDSIDFKPIVINEIIDKYVNDNEHKIMHIINRQV